MSVSTQLADHAHHPPRHAHISNSPRPHRGNYASPALVSKYHQRPVSSCSTESNYSVVGRQGQRRPKRQHQHHQSTSVDNGYYGDSYDGSGQLIYSTFKPPVEMANAATTTEDECQTDGNKY